MKNIRLMIIMLFAAFASCSMADDNGSDDLDATYATQMLQTGTDAPAFALPTVNGDTIALADYKGKYVVLDFWASWCPDCQKVLPTMVEAYNSYKDKAAFLGVSFDNDKETLQKAIEKYGLKYPQVSEFKAWKETAIKTSYQIKWIPGFYIVNPQGKIELATVEITKIEKFLQNL